MKRRNLIIALLIILILLLASTTFLFYLALRGVRPPAEISYTSTVQSSQYIIEYQTKDNGSSPNAIAVDSSGNVWFVLGKDNALAELTPSNNTIHQFHVPVPSNYTIMSWGIAIDNSRRLVWFADLNGGFIWRFNITNNVFTRYPVKTQAALPYDLSLDSQGDVWFTELVGKIGEISTQGNLSEIPLPVPSVEATGITVDNANKVWINFGHEAFTSNTSSYYVASYYGGAFSVYNLTGKLSEPQGIAADSHGNLWITQHGPSLISEFNPATNYFMSISTSVPPWAVDQTTLPYFVSVDSRGDVWFTEHYGNAIGVYYPSNGTMVEYEVPTRIVGAGNLSFTLTLGLSPEGQPWFTEFLTGKVGTVNISKPVGLSLSVAGNELQGNKVALNRSGTNLKLSVAGSPGESIRLGAYVGNFSQGPQFNFSQVSGTGDLSSNLSIKNGTPITTPRVYFITISAETSTVIYSRVIEVVVS